MTTEEREQVVELLRCAAEHADGIQGAMIEKYGIESIIGAAIAEAAIDARFRSGDAYNDRRDYCVTCLAAAQRVEEGSWP